MILSVLKALKYQAFPILTAIAIGLAPAFSWARRPEMISWLLDPARSNQWHMYFRALSQNKNEAEIGDAFRSLHIEMLKEGVANDYIRVLQTMRNDLPTEIRWLLAAHEIYRQNISPETLPDAVSAVLNTEIVERIGWFILFPEVDKYLVYKDPKHGGDRREMPLITINNLMFLHGQWQRAPTLPGYKNLSPEVELRLQNKKIDWISSIEKTARQLTARDIEELLTYMEPPETRQFFNRQQSDRFSDFAKLLLIKMRRRLSYENANFPGIKSKIMSWMDLDYQLHHFDELKRYGFVTPEEIVRRPLQPEDIKTLRRILGQKLYFVDSQVLAAFLWARNQTQTADEEISDVASRRVFDILFNAKINTHDDRGVSAGIGTLRKQWLQNGEFRIMINFFFEIFSKPNMLKPDLAADLLQQFSPRFEGQSDEEWIDWEWKRLQTAENSMPAEEFKEFLVKRAVRESDSTLLDQVIAAKYLRLKMNIPNLEEVALRLKSRAEGVKTTSFKGVKTATWSREHGRLISALKALRPDDPDLKNYLSMVYTTRHMEGAISPQKALQLLNDTSVATDDMKEAMLKKLLKVSPGDSQETFKIFLKQFPKESPAIIDIIYVHRGVKEKIVPLMATLVESAKSNPEILSGLEENIKKHPNKNVAAALYQGLTLDSWLRQKLGGTVRCKTIFKPGSTGVAHGT